jgi:CarD family transcriptional regulator
MNDFAYANHNERGNNMFKTGEKVVNGNGITCVIDKVERMKVPHSKLSQDYYVMHDLYHSDNVYYIPTDKDASMRYLISDADARSLIDSIDSIEAMTVTKERFRDEAYRQGIKSCSPAILIGMLKFFYVRKNKRISAGKNLSSVDEKYMRIASRNLFSELSCSLSISPDEVENIVYSKIK